MDKRTLDVEVIEGENVQLFVNKEDIPRHEKLMIAYQLKDNGRFMYVKELIGKVVPETNTLIPLKEKDIVYLHKIGRIYVQELQRKDKKYGSMKRFA